MLVFPGSKASSCRMGRVDLHIAVPSHFRCPISLDIMKSPVSLSTGVSYDRSSIEKWLADGNNTCPATMQPLQSRELIPNHTLRRLIQSWCAAVQVPSSEDCLRGFWEYPADPQQLKLVLQEISDKRMLQEGLKELSRLSNNESNRVCLVEAGVVPVLSSVLFSHDLVSGNPSSSAIENCENAIRILSLIPLDDKDKKIVIEPKRLASIFWFLRNGTSKAKSNAALLLERLASSNDLKLLIGGTDGLLRGLLQMLIESDLGAVDASLRCIQALLTLKRNRVKAIEAGAILCLVKLLEVGKREYMERALATLELLCGSADGRAALLACPSSVPTIVKTILRATDLATEHAILILWAICYLSPEAEALQAVVDSNGNARILLLLQSNCTSRTKEKAMELLRMCRKISAKDGSSSTRDSQLTDIRPF